MSLEMIDSSQYIYKPFALYPLISWELCMPHELIIPAMSWILCNILVFFLFQMIKHGKCWSCVYLFKKNDIFLCSIKKIKNSLVSYKSIWYIIN